MPKPLAPRSPVATAAGRCEPALGIREHSALLRADQQLRWRRGERLLVERYLEELRISGAGDELTLDLLFHEILLRQERGETPQLVEYLARFPQYAVPLKRHFALPGLAGHGDPGAATLSVDVTPASDQRPPSLPATDHGSADDGAPATMVPVLMPGGLATPTDHPPDEAGPVPDALPDTDPPFVPTVPFLSPAMLAGPPAATSAATTDGRTPSDGGAEVEGKPDVPGYEILDELGRGGMGVVYKARHLRLGRIVALKMILAGDHAGERSLARFRAEAEAVARIQHPHIVQIYEIGEDRGLPYFSLEYCAGGNLEKKLASNPLPPRQAAALIEKLARGIHVAHQAGIVHRDLKPANILLSPRAPARPAEAKTPDTGPNAAPWKLDDWEPKITDFGLAKKLDEAGLTQSGAIMGTPSYMAPEQASAKSEAIGPVTDVYALGAVLYDLVTGRPPFRAVSSMDTLLQVLSTEPVPLRALQPSTPRDLDTICLCCLQKPAAKRYPSALALAEDLRRFLADEPIQARPVPAWERAYRWARRRPAAAALVALSSLTVLGVLVLSLWFNGYLQYAVREARADEKQARQEAEALDAAARQERRLTGLKAEGLDALRRGEKALAAGQSQEAQLVLVQALTRLGDEPGVEWLRVQAKDLLARAKAKDDAQAAERAARQRYDEFGRRRFEAVFQGSLATGEDSALHLARGREEAQAALALFGVGLEGTGAPATGPSFSAEEADDIKAGCYELLLVWAETLAQGAAGQRPDQRRRQLEQALRVLDRAATVDTPTQAYQRRRARYRALLGGAAEEPRDPAVLRAPTTPLDFFLAGDEYRKQRDLVQAVHAFEKALALRPDYFWARYFQAVSYLEQGQWTAGKVGLTACIARQPTFVWTYLLRGVAQGQLNDLAGAEADFARALQLLHVHPNPDAEFGLYLNRAAVRALRGHHAEAVEDLKKAIALRPNNYQPHAHLAVIQEQQQQWAEAVTHFTAALWLAPDQPRLYRQRAQVFRERRDLTAALQDIDQALKLELRQGSRPSERAATLTERGRVLFLLKRYDEAVSAFDLALQDDPGLFAQELSLWRGEALFELKRHDEALRDLDAYVKKRPSALAYRLAGLARARLGKHLEAIDDYTQSLRLKADAKTYLLRGWEHLLVCQAVPLAQRDFDAAMQLAPKDGEAYTGRAYVRVKLGRCREALADVEEALTRGPLNPRLLCLNAHVYARAAEWLTARATGRAATVEAASWQARALDLIAQAIDLVPEAQRGTFWQELAGDRELDSLRRTSGFGRLEAKTK